jgi:tripartite-type tricarboxylate transporter receptor subunit TctC
MKRSHPARADDPGLSEIDNKRRRWFGLGVPKATPAEIVNKLNKEVNAALDDPKMKARLADLGGTPLPGSPVQFGKLIAEETEKWGKVIRALNIKAE